MRKFISTHLFRNQRVTPAHLETLAASGVDGVELFCSRPGFDYRDTGQMTELAGWLRDHALPVHSMHSPIYYDEHGGRAGEPALNIAATEARVRLQALDEIQAALEFATRVPVGFLIQHIGTSRDPWSARKADAALTSLELLRLRAKQAGVTLLVENIPNGLSTPAKLMELLKQGHLDDVGICFDAGHAHMPEDSYGGGGVLESWRTVQPRVRSTHLHDNHGQSDEHLWPGDGTIDWPSLVAALRAQGPNFPWVLEVGGHGAAEAHRIGPTFERLQSMHV